MPSAAVTTGKNVLHRCSSRLDATHRKAALPIRRNPCVPIAAATTASSSIVSLCTSRRTYFWPYPDNFVPEGAATSSFQSSPVPSVRERIVREYALSPTFGHRTPCCILGFTDAASTRIESKHELRRCIAQALGKSEAEVKLGPLYQTKEMMLHRSGTDESPRLADGPWSRPDAEERRRSRYARLPVQARTLVEVYLPNEEEAGDEGGNEAEEEIEAAILAHGWYLQEQLYQHMSALKRKMSKSDEPHDDDAPKKTDDVAASIAALHDDFGVVYCEVPTLDESDFLFDQVGGKEVDADTAMRVVDRWARRVAQQQQGNEEQKEPA